MYSHLVAPAYSIDWDEVRSLICPKTRMIIINTPHNPTGSVLSAQDLKTLEEVTRGTDIIVLSDEVYEHIIFDDSQRRDVGHPFNPAVPADFNIIVNVCK